MRALGVQLKGRIRFRLAQPCGCFDGRLCNIYAERPARCRQFACGVLKRVQAGEVSEAAGLKHIHEAQRKVARVRQLLRQAGDHDEAKPLMKRYARAMAQPVDLSAGDASAEVRGELMLAMADLMEHSRREFLT